MHIVFTGAAHKADGTPVVRHNLVKAAENCGYTVDRAITTKTQLLIASRDDTVKAKRAKERGVTVMSYPEFIAELLSDRVPDTGAKPNAFTDGKKKSGYHIGIPYGDNLG